MFKGKSQLLQEKITEFNQSSDSFIFNLRDLTKTREGEYNIVSTELSNQLYSMLKGRERREDNFYCVPRTFYGGIFDKDQWLVMKKNHIYEVAKASSRFGSEVLDFRTKGVGGGKFLRTSEIKFTIPHIFGNISRQDWEKIINEESQGERQRREQESQQFVNLLNLRSQVNQEISDEMWKSGIRENDLGSDFMTLFFNDNCVCERAGDITSHLISSDKCLKTETEIKNFKDQVISIIRKTAPNRNNSNENERERVNPHQGSPNNPFPQPNSYDYTLANFKHSTILKLIDKRWELDIKHKIFFSANEINLETEYQNTFKHHCPFSESGCSFVNHIWNCLKTSEEVKEFADQLIPVLESIYLRKSQEPHRKKLTETEIREKFQQEKEKWTEINETTKRDREKDGKRPSYPEREKDSPPLKPTKSEKDLKSQIEKLKQEIQALKNIPNRTSEQEKQLVKKEKELTRLEKELASKKPESDTNFPTGLVVGSAVLLVVVGLITIMIIRKLKKKTVR